MTGRRLYTLLVCLHPPQFRHRFGEELVATFDDAVKDRGSFALLLDGLVSLLRQWALRPANWRKYRPGASLAQGLPSALLTERAYRRVRHLNFLWFTGCFLIWTTVLPSRPDEEFLDSFIFFVMMSGVLTYWAGSPISLLSRIYVSPIRISGLFKRLPGSSGNTTRDALKKRVDRLRSFNPFFAVLLMFYHLTRPQPWTPFLISLVLFLSASALGLFVRRANREIAGRIAGEIPAE